MKNTIEQTTELLHSIYDYCHENELILWVECKGFFNRIYVSDKTIFETYRQTAEYRVYELNLQKINELEANIVINNKNNISFNCSLAPWHNWAINNHKKHNELFLHAFWSNDKEILGVFLEHWFSSENNINLNYLMNYKNKKYPEGFFSDSSNFYLSSISENNHNWRSLIEFLPVKNLISFFDEEENRKIFFENLKKEDFFAHSYLRCLVQKVKDNLNENICIDLSYKIMDLFKDNESYQKGYSNSFPFMKQLIKKIDYEKLFTQEEYRVEKFEIKIQDVYQCFELKETILLAEEYRKITKEVIKNIGENIDLKNMGLKHLDLIENNNYYGYLNLTKESSIDNYKIIAIFKESMDFSINEKIKNKDFNMSLIKEIVNKVVSKNKLQKELLNNNVFVKKIKI